MSITQSSARTSPLQSNSATETIVRFDTAAAAAKYSRALNGTATHRREMRCILTGLKDLGTGAAVLDVPCGTGRLLPELTARGFHVTSVDSSGHMVELARAYAHECSITIDPARFVVASALHLPFQDHSFDAVVCNRLLHHFHEAAVRIDAMRELRRVSRGPIIASFFCSFSYDSAVFHFKNSLRKTKAKDRIPISRRAFDVDARASGLRVMRWLPIRPGLSKQWYAVMVRS